MLKKMLVLLLALAMVFSLIGCGPTDEPASDNDQGEAKNDEPAGPEFKIGIMTGTVSQGEEEFRKAQDMKSLLGDMIVTATYPDRFMQEQETTITNMMAMASDPLVKAIVMVQAVPGAAAAIDKVREVRPDMLFILGAPAEDPDMLASKADIIFETNNLGRGYQIVEHAQAMGAEVLVHYSFPRHMSIEFLAQRRDLMKKRAAEIGLKFVEIDSPDPTGDAGVPGTQQFIMEDIPRAIEEFGVNTAFFGTNCAMMEPMIKQAIEYGGIFPVQCCPSPYHALPGALGIEIPEDKKGDLDFILTAIKDEVAERGATGRVATWPVPVNMMYIEAGVLYAKAYLEGETEGRVDRDKLVSILEKIAGGKVDLTNYADHENFFMYMSDHIIF